MVSGLGSPGDRCQDGPGSRGPRRCPYRKPRLGSLGAAMMWAGLAEASTKEPGLGGPWALGRCPFPGSNEGDGPAVSLAPGGSEGHAAPQGGGAPPRAVSVAPGARAGRC